MVLSTSAGRSGAFFKLHEALLLYHPQMHRCTIGFTYTQEFLQECFRSIDVNAGDGAVASQHSIHRGRNLPPVVLSIGVEVSFVMFYVPHPVIPENGKIKYK